LKKLKARNPIKIVCIAVISLLAAWMVFYSVAWHIKVNYVLSPFMSKHKKDFQLMGKGYSGSLYLSVVRGESNSTDWQYTVLLPSYNPLKKPPGHIPIFAQEADVVANGDEQDYIHENDYAYSFAIFPAVFSKYKYYVEIVDLSKSNEKMTDGGIYLDSYNFEVDENMDLLPGYENDSDYNEQSIELFKKCSGEIKELWQKRLVDYLGAKNVYKHKKN